MWNLLKELPKIMKADKILKDKILKEVEKQREETLSVLRWCQKFTMEVDGQGEEDKRIRKEDKRMWYARHRTTVLARKLTEVKRMEDKRMLRLTKED